MANKSSGNLQAGYGNGGIEPMAQFDKLSDKITNSLKNLEFTRDMLRQLAENEKKSAKNIAAILNQKNKSLRFSVVDQAIQSFWKKQESNRRHFAEALQTKIIDELENYIGLACEKKKKLQKENSKIQKNFIECKKETIKLQQIGLKDWQKLEEQINKNDQYKKTNKRSKIKDLKPLQDKCSKTFNKYEMYILKLNELEQINHEQSCRIGQLLHESQKYASNRLSMHYNIAVSYKKFMDEFINKNKSIVQSKAPPLNDILWRWLTYPKNHQSATYLPCTSKEVFKKNEIGQQFKKIVQPDYQNSKHLKPPQQKQQKQPQKQPQQIKKKKKKKTQQQPKQQQTTNINTNINDNQLDDNWDVNFDDNNNNNNNNNNTDVKFDDNTDVKFENNTDVKFDDNTDVKFEKNTDVKFDDNFGFDDDNNFDFDNGNKDLEIVNKNNSKASFGNDWNTNFDEDTFVIDNNKNKEEDIDALFAVSEANDIFGNNNNNNN
eukprot:247922_1